MTEVYVPNSEADSSDRWPESIQVAENIHNAFVVGNMNAYVWWYIRRSYGPMKEDGTISKRGYCMAQYSKFVRSGDVRIDATEQPTEDVYISAYKNSSNQIVVVAVNEGSEGYAQNFSLSTDSTITQVERYRTSETESLAHTASLDASDSSFWAQLPAESVSTFIITLDGSVDTGEDGNESGNESGNATTPDANGYYFHDTFEGDTGSWEGHGAADVLLSGRTPYADAEALLVENRSASWHGAQKVLDADTFRSGQAYSFSVCVTSLAGKAMQEFALTLQYTNADGETKYARVASASTIRGSYVQLANDNFTIPEGASNLVLYVETGSGMENFYLDEAIGAVAGTQIDGPAPISLTLGDCNNDGVINIFDLTLAKICKTSGAPNHFTEVAADVDEDGSVTLADLLQIRDRITGKTDAFFAEE